MERLTEHWCAGGIRIKGCSTLYVDLERKGAPVANAIIRLAAYEDALPLERAQELAQAEKDGRLVVLPCKVGDTVWTNISVVGDRYKSADRPYQVEVVFIGIGSNGGFFHVQYSNGRVFPFDFDKIGKAVFLTREEAETALKKKEADDEAN